MKTAGSPGASLRLREKKGKDEGILSSSVILVAVFSAWMQRHIRSTELSFLKKGGTAGLIPRPFAFAGTGFFSIYILLYYCISIPHCFHFSISITSNRKGIKQNYTIRI